MPDAPLVSVVTPCLNPGSRLARCLDSVAAQTYAHVEHVVVDGGSTDGTVELLRARGTTFVSEPDRGQTDAINKGFALARGDVLGWLNADDVLTPPAVELAVGALAAAPEAGWVYGDCDELVDGERRPGLRPPSHLGSDALDRGNLIPQPATFVTRRALDAVGPLDEDLHLAMDYDLWLRLLVAGIPAVHVPEVLAVFELHPSSKTETTPRSEFVLEEAISLLRRGRPRAAARAVARSTLLTPGADVDRQAARVPGVDARLVRAFAYAELAQSPLVARPRRLRYLLRPEPWLAPETRRELLGVLRAAAAHRLGRAAK